jgi:hypothetical protein
MYQVRFVNRREIRMGSPYNLADAVVEGDYVPDLSRYEFQDVAATSPEGNDLYLVFWDLHGNAPAFRVLWLSEDKRSARVSERVPAACNELIATPESGTVRARVWDVYDGERMIDIIFPEE